MSSIITKDGLPAVTEIKEENEKQIGRILILILGIIGLFNIPLDMMTITIAAITIGIAVDNSIHYIYRFKEEFLKSGDYSKTV